VVLAAASVGKNREHVMSSLSPMDACLRPEGQDDLESIRHVNIMAFERTEEADLVDSLRGAGAVTLSVVTVLGAHRLGGTGTSDAFGADDTAEVADATDADTCALCACELYGGEIVGHVLFTPVVVATQDGELPLLGLGPVAVLPANQRQGLGTMMLSGCLEYLRAQGHRGVVVVGDPDFYRRFGFINASRWGLRSEFPVPDENFMALSLKPGVLGGFAGTVRYRPEFGQVE
jgi:putative acetyltransferase